MSRDCSAWGHEVGGRGYDWHPQRVDRKRSQGADTRVWKLDLAWTVLAPHPTGPPLAAEMSVSRAGGGIWAGQSWMSSRGGQGQGPIMPEDQQWGVGWAGLEAPCDT